MVQLQPQQYSTVTLAQRIEKQIIKRLEEKYVTVGAGGVTILDLYLDMREQPWGSQVTTGFLNKILSDLRKVGIIVMYKNGGEMHASLSDTVKSRMEKAAYEQELKQREAAQKAGQEGAK